MESGRIEGIVLAEGKPVPGVEIQVSAKEENASSLRTQTNESGLFSVSGLSPNMVHLMAYKPDYVRQMLKVNLDEQWPLVIHLEKGAILRGRILCEGFHGRSEIVLIQFDGSQIKKMMPRHPNPQYPHDFEFTDLAIGTYRFDFNSNFFELAEPRTIQIDSAKEYEVNVTLVPLAAPRSVTWTIPDIPGVET